ncbi:cortistatin isoform X1 [Vidua macroura]|uniref:cortistatin isoform X1 n=1 Tax=Vidua macroura TaxID=187451 RepID=UPI0023A903D5|nr:cortistatin isoform X1 [Vidua macroura]
MPGLGVSAAVPPSLHESCLSLCECADIQLFLRMRHCRKQSLSSDPSARGLCGDSSLEWGHSLKMSHKDLIIGPASAGLVHGKPRDTEVSHSSSQMLTTSPKPNLPLI